MTGLREKIDYEQYVPNLGDLNKYFDDMGFVGDEKTRMILSIGTIRRKALGVVSGSGSGKTALTDAMLSMFRPLQIYKMEAGSATAEAYSADKINNADIIYLTEIQKAANSDIVIEILKNLGEGKDYTRKVVRNGGNDMETQVIKKGKTVLYTKAIENKFETDDELDRRFPRVTTDMSRHQSEEVIKSKASKRSNPDKKHILDEKQTNSLKYHMSDLLRQNASKYVYINPMADFLAKYIPATFAVSRTYTDHYFDFIEGVAFFNNRKRIITKRKIGNDMKDVILVAPEDCWQLHSIYNEQFLQDVLNIPPNGIHVLKCFTDAKRKGIKSSVKRGAFAEKVDDDKTKLSIEQIFLMLKEAGLVLKETLITKIITDLMMSGYIREEVTMMANKKMVEYYLSAEIRDFQDNINWNEAIREGLLNLEKNFPDLVPEYKAKYLGTQFTDPFTGELISVVKHLPRPVVDVNADNRDQWLET